MKEHAKRGTRGSARGRVEQLVETAKTLDESQGIALQR